MAAAGFDIGTSNCSCFVIGPDGGPPQLVPSEVGTRLTPSCVAYVDGDEVLTGEAAVQQQISNPRNTFVEFKRLIGRKWSQRVLWKDAEWPYKLAEPRPNETDLAPRYVVVRDDASQIRLTALDLYSNLIGAMARQLRAHIGDDVALRAVTITVPAHFDPHQRRETLDAARRAGLFNVRLLNEPSAAALAYGLDRAPAGSTVLVLDLGAGTFDVTCVRVGDGFTVLSSEGQCGLGGADFDARLVQVAAKHFKKTTKLVLKTNPARLVAARAACEQAKRILSSRDRATITVGENAPPLTVTRTEFAKMIEPELRRCAETIDTVVRQVDAPIDRIVLVGGSSRVPAFKALVERMFKGVPIEPGVNPDECVGLGACLHAASVAASLPPPIRDVVSATIGIKTGHNVMHPLLHKDDPLPAQATERLTTLDARATFADISVHQGESKSTDDNIELGVVRLKGLKPGHPAVHLELTANADGIVTVVVRDDAGHTITDQLEVVDH